MENYENALEMRKCSNLIQSLGKKKKETSVLIAYVFKLNITILNPLLLIALTVM